MGAFNTLKVVSPCLSCQQVVELNIQFKYGDVWQHSYSIGERLKWGGNDIGVPEARRVVVDGAGEQCPKCGYEGDYYIILEQDKLSSFEAASGKYDLVSCSESFLILDG